MAKRHLLLIVLVLVNILVNGCSKVSFYTPENVANGSISEFVSISSDDQYMVFAYYKDGVSLIYRANADGKNVIQLTFPKNRIHIRPRYSPDNKRILFISYPNYCMKPQSILWIMNSDGSNVKQLTSGKDNITEATFSNDGNTIYYLKSGWYGNYSPIARSFPHDFDIYSVNIDGTDEKKITDAKEYYMSDLCISKDGKKIYFRKDQYENPNHYHYFYLDNPNKLIPIKLRGEYERREYYDPELSPDEKIMAFTMNTQKTGTYEYELFTMDMSSKEVKQLTNLKSQVAQPCFFNKTNKILFVQDLNWPNHPSKYQLMQIDTDGVNIKKIDIDIQN